MLFSSNVSGYCSNVNSVTGNVVITSYTTGSTFWPTIANVSSANSYYLIARAYFQKMSFTTNIPGGMEEQKIYYLRKFANNVVKIYMTRTDAINAVNHVTFTSTVSGYLFVVYFPDIYYRGLNAWKPAESQISGIPCCPPVPSVYTEIPDTATITFNGQQIAIKRNGGESSRIRAFEPNTKWWQNGNISSHPVHIHTVNPPVVAIPNYYKSVFSIFFGHHTDQSGQVRPVLTQQIFLGYQNDNITYTYYMGYRTYIGDSSINSSNSMNLVYDNSNTTYAPGYLDNYIFPSTIPVTFSGNTEPPSQVKVFMPDAYFPNKNKPINLGHVEEILTYDPDTLTYWGDVRTYAGIEGRIHFSIPNYYPLTSSGTKYVNQSPNFEFSFQSGLTAVYGDFSDDHLNYFSNSEFSFYQTCYVEQDTNYESKLRLFVASDAYNGYSTGLPQGKTWFDSRLIYNTKNADFIKAKKMLIAFSKWGTAKFNKSNGVRSFEVSSTGTDLSHYTRNFYAIKSVHPNAHITSLGI